MSKSFLKELLFLAYDKSLESDPQAMREAWSKSLKANGIPIPDWDVMTQIDRDESIYLALKASGAEPFVRKNIYPLLDRRIWIPNAVLELDKTGVKIVPSVIKSIPTPEVFKQVQPVLSVVAEKVIPDAPIEKIESVTAVSVVPASLQVAHEPSPVSIPVIDTSSKEASSTASSTVNVAEVAPEANVSVSEKLTHTLHLKDSSVLKTALQTALQTAETAKAKADAVEKTSQPSPSIQAASKEVAPKVFQPAMASTLPSSEVPAPAAQPKTIPVPPPASQETPMMAVMLPESAAGQAALVAPVLNADSEQTDRRGKKYSSVDSQTECEFILARGLVIGAMTIGPLVIEGKELSPVRYRVLFDEKSKSFSIIENRGDSMRLFECPRAKKFLGATLSVQIRDEYGRCNHVGLAHLSGSELLFKIEEMDKQFLQFSCFLDQNAPYFKYLEPKSEVMSQGLVSEVAESPKMESVLPRAIEPAASSFRAKEVTPQEPLSRDSSYRGVRSPQPYQPQARSKAPAYQASYIAPVAASLLQHVARPKTQPIKAEYKAEANWDSEEDLTDEDLARLRCELPMEPAYPRHR